MKQFFFLLFLLPGLAQAQTNRYVSTSYRGENGASDGSRRRPYANWLQVPSLQPGDSVFFKRGDVFPLNATLQIQQGGTQNRPIYLGAYGIGAKPVLSAMARLQGWTKSANGIWYTASATEPTIVVVDGVVKGKGRYPKDKYNLYTINPSNASSVTEIADASLAGGPSWVGAEVVVRNGGQTCAYRTVTDQTGDGTLVLNAPVKSPNNNYGYFFRNHLHTLTAPGDWMYNKAEGRVYMYLGSDTAHNVQVARDVDETVFTNRSYLTLQNLTIEGATENGIKLKNARHVLVDSCEIRYCFNGCATDGGSAAKKPMKEGATDNVYSHNYFHDITSTGVRVMTTCPRFTFEYNTLANIGMVLGTGDQGTTSGIGMYLIASDMTVQYNRFLNIGFMPIYFRRNNILIKNNYINGFSFTKDDTGGIYGWTEKGSEADNATNRVVEGNIVLNGQGKSGAGNNGANFRANGIYMDFADHVTVRNNVVQNVSGYGLFIHQASGNTVQDNIVYNAGRGAANFEENSKGRNPLRNTDFSNNVILASGGRLLKFTRKLSDNEDQFGLFANNVYGGTGDTRVDANGEALSMDAWQKASKLDPKSLFQNNSDVRVEYNETGSPKTVNLGGKRYRNLKTNAVVSGTLTLQPYESAALLSVSR